MTYNKTKNISRPSLICPNNTDATPIQKIILLNMRMFLFFQDLGHYIICSIISQLLISNNILDIRFLFFFKDRSAHFHAFFFPPHWKSQCLNMTIRKTIKDKSQDKNRISHLGQIHEEASAYWRKIKAIF